MIHRPLQAGFGWRPGPAAAAPSDRELPAGDRAETPEAGGIGPREGETFSETLRRLARQLHPDKVKGDDEPAKRMPRAVPLWDREPGADDDGPAPAWLSTYVRDPAHQHPADIVERAAAIPAGAEVTCPECGDVLPGSGPACEHPSIADRLAHMARGERLTCLNCSQVVTA